MLRISVIIPTLNEEAEIANAVKSCQCAGADEVIVVDGGSDDRTVPIAEELGAIICLPERCGRSNQQNFGAERATGDVLLFLHADCCLPSGAADEVRRVLESCPTTLGGCFQQRIVAEGRRFRLLEAGNFWRARVLKWAYGDQGIFVRASTFRAIGCFPDVPIMEDLFLMKRLKREGHIAVLQSRLLVSARRWQHRGIFRQTIRNWGFVLAAHLGVSPERLVQHYPNVR